MASIDHKAHPITVPSTVVSEGSTAEPVIYTFDSYQLNPVDRLLRCDGRDITLPGRAFDVLLLLVRRAGALVVKEEIMATVWQGSFVEDSNLTVAISTLRRALKEEKRERRLIQTVARYGYRFAAEVQEVPKVARPKGVVAPGLLPVSEDTAEANDEVTTYEEAPRVVRSWSGIWGLSAAVGATLLLLIGAWLMLHPRQSIRSLAVLPFTAARTGPQAAAKETTINNIVLIGMTDGLISALGKEFIVRPTSSILRYTSAGAVDPVAAGREQGVDAVLAGQLGNKHDTSTLHLELIRVRDGFTLWQDTFHAPDSDLSRLEQEVDASAIKALQGFRSSDVPRGISHPAAAEAHTSDASYQPYLLGRYFWNRRTADGLRKSADYFRQAINADPNYARAYAGLADCYALMASFSVEPGTSANADARSAALSAIHLDPTLADPHASLGMIYFFTDWNLGGAEREFEKAIQLNPNYATAHHWYALDLAAMSRPAEALYEIQLAHRLDPLSLIIGTNVGWVEYLARDYPAAIRDLHHVLELDPDFARARTRLGMVEMATGNNAAAIADLTRALELTGDEDPWVEGLLGEALARSGDRAAAVRKLAELNQRSMTRYVPPISRALILLGLGRNAEALIALQQAVEDHSTSMVYARVDPVFDPIRTDPGFRSLLSRSKL